MRDYVILTCYNAGALFEWGRNLHKIWIPLFDGRPAMNGYAFLPTQRWPELRRRSPEHFQVKAFGHDFLGRPKTITMAELTDMQQYLNDYRGEADIRLGDFVEIVIGPFGGLVGRVLKIKGQDARLLLGNRYLTQPLAILRRL